MVKITFFTPVTVEIPVTAPSAAPKVPGSLFSLSIEQDRWLDWAGNTSRNEFFFNVLDNLISITDEGPKIRIGADSEDRTTYQQGIEGAQLDIPGPSSDVPYPEASNVTVGDGFYEAARFLPPGTHVIWGVNLKADNITQAVLQAQAIHRAFSSSAIEDAGIILDFVEIGNEPDQYGRLGKYRPLDYNVSDYVTEWTAFAVNVSKAAAISSSSHTKFWAGAFTGSSTSNTSFSPQGIISNGILDSAPGKLITAISRHRYSGGNTASVLQDLMSKETIRSNVTILNPDIVVSQSQGLDYVLGEVNSYSGHGAPGVSDVAGAALWALDYAFVAREAGISRLFFHEGIGYRYNLIQPATLTISPRNGSELSSPLPPHIQPAYYAAVIAAEAIGKGGNTQIAELIVNNTMVSGHGFFVDGRITRAVFINLEAFLTTSSSRQSVHVDLSFASGGPSEMSIKRLAIGHADDESGVTWGGVSYETTDGRPSGKESVETVDVSSGFDIKATEVVLLSF
ncbi:hypothetical protein K435DRAFT_817806 [Dendrothele bispora CBS 962.96]|uniref:Beta-glucuronidase C-terminal domain-containing protein n=1 Tax=Dendrothele bispora (strain CBS 962.96) TaxID=1314807 RepID=A0A4S8MJA5_DENBC|nr:hypothetical protein K435DRAFT_817806 [Dendrothele bispora CBS 962.96]